MKTLGERLKLCRKQKKVTQEVAAKAIGMSQTNLSELESDLYPSSSFVPMMAEFYGVSSLWLATGKGRKEPGGLTPEQIEVLAMWEKLDAEDRKAVFKHGNSLAQSTQKKPNNGTQ